MINSTSQKKKRYSKQAVSNMRAECGISHWNMQISIIYVRAQEVVLQDHPKARVMWHSDGCMDRFKSVWLVRSAGMAMMVARITEQRTDSCLEMTRGWSVGMNWEMWASISSVMYLWRGGWSLWSKWTDENERKLIVLTVFNPASNIKQGSMEYLLRGVQSQTQGCRWSISTICRRSYSRPIIYFWRHYESGGWVKRIVEKSN